MKILYLVISLLSFNSSAEDYWGSIGSKNMNQYFENSKKLEPIIVKTQCKYFNNYYKNGLNDLFDYKNFDSDFKKSMLEVSTKTKGTVDKYCSSEGITGIDSQVAYTYISGICFNSCRKKFQGKLDALIQNKELNECLNACNEYAQNFHTIKGAILESYSDIKKQNNESDNCIDSVSTSKRDFSKEIIPENGKTNSGLKSLTK